MDVINNSNVRVGRITSSEIVALVSKGKKEGEPGAPFYTYIEETAMERRLQLSISTDVTARPLSWGKLGEKHVFGLPSMLSYTLFGDVPMQHPSIESWAGSPDATRGNGIVVADVKCPITRKSFCQFLDPYKKGGAVIHKAMTIEAVRANHKDGDKYYWQLVSNAILTGATKGELIIYMPYKSELDAIRELAQQQDSDELKNYYWIANASDEELPYINEGGHYKNLNVITFDIPQEDKDFLTERVLLATELLEVA